MTSILLTLLLFMFLYCNFLPPYTLRRYSRGVPVNSENIQQYLGENACKSKSKSVRPAAE